MNPGALVRDEVKKTSVHIDTYRLGPDGGLSDSHYHRNLWAFIRYSTREELVSKGMSGWPTISRLSVQEKETMVASLRKQSSIATQTPEKSLASLPRAN